MSKAGAVHIRNQRQAGELVEQITTNGLLVVATEKWGEREQRRIEHAERSILRLALKLGIPPTDPFIISEWDDLYPPHQRVCMRIDGLLLNYFAGNKDRDESLQLVSGRCSVCQETPRLETINELADLASPVTPHGERAIAEWVCYDCRKARRADY